MMMASVAATPTMSEAKNAQFEKVNTSSADIFISAALPVAALIPIRVPHS
jgi:hypothetical protein